MTANHLHQADAQGNATDRSNPTQGSISSELIREVTAKVYGLLLMDLKRQQERYGPQARGSSSARRGR